MNCMAIVRYRMIPDSQNDSHFSRLNIYFGHLKEVSLMAKDPVCNMNVDEKKAAATSAYKGKTYYFCAKGCKEKFDKEPEKFITKEKE